jgi:hypothetical protein
VTGRADETLTEQATEVDDVADLINRLTLIRIDPERFHVQRDEIVKRLRRAAGRIRKAAGGREPTTTWRPDGRR